MNKGLFILFVHAPQDVIVAHGGERVSQPHEGGGKKKPITLREQDLAAFSFQHPLSLQLSFTCVSTTEVEERRAAEGRKLWSEEGEGEQKSTPGRKFQCTLREHWETRSVKSGLV